MATAADDIQLRVGAHVLIQLGRELVTDPEQALLELVKNAYDADSRRCWIEVDTQATGTLTQSDEAERLLRFDADTQAVKVSLTSDAGGAKQIVRDTPEWKSAAAEPTQIVNRHLRYTGSIVIRDEGAGLSREAVRSSWLVVSNSVKRVEKGRPKTKTAGGRTPLGDKGLGRLGTMRLGDILYLKSAQAGSDKINIAWFRWADCDGAETLDRIPVEVEEEPNRDGFRGTEVRVLGLEDIAAWRDRKRAERVAFSIASIVSPFEAIETFPVSVTIDGESRSLASVTDDLLRQAVASYEFRYCVNAEGDGMLHTTACFRQDLFKASSSSKARGRADRVFAGDKGAGFLSWLGKNNFARRYDEVAFAADGDCIIRCMNRIPFSKIAKDRQTELADPGSFHGALYYFNFGRSGGAPAGVGVTRDAIQRIGGVAILRDGFRVRSGDDWINLARSMTSGSTYHLRVENTTGYFALSGEKNFNLTEKSDREGFVSDEYYQGFMAVAERCRDFANKAQEHVRRSLDQYARSLEETEAGWPHHRPAEAARQIRRAPAVVSESVRRAEQRLEEYRSDIALLDKDDPAVPPAIQAEQAIDLAKRGLMGLEGLAADFGKMRDLAAAGVVIANEIELRTEQAAALVESAAVGLAARGLTHEMRSHLGEIERNTNGIRTLVRSTPLGDRIGRHLRHIDLARRAIAGAANQIDPMLPRTRAVKDRIVLAAFVRDYFAARQAELQREGTEADVMEEAEGVTVKMNSNRLLQVIDNLVLNSRYWLQDADGPGAGQRRISIVVDARGFVLSDNGPGVEPKLEDTIFDLFTTSKPADAPGQGLGLYIVTQLLLLDGCSIDLLPERNASARRHRFRVDLIGAMT